MKLTQHAIDRAIQRLPRTMKHTRVLHILRTLAKETCFKCYFKGALTYDPDFNLWRHSDGEICCADAIVKMIEKIKGEA